MNQRESIGELTDALRKVAERGPLPAVGAGAHSVGMTLLDALGVPYSSARKPNFKGIVVNARRVTTARRGLARRSSRVNLFAQVPDWTISDSKSSREILYAHGYARDGGERKLYCTVRTGYPNSQGLYLRVDSALDLLHEEVAQDGGPRNVASWSLPLLESRLAQTHPMSMWVSAHSSFRNGQEFFHYVEAQYTPKPKSGVLSLLLGTGTITVDHLILERFGRVSEKGPLFKIDPLNIHSLFPDTGSFRLLGPASS